jgi:hypothetical protein
MLLKDRIARELARIAEKNAGLLRQEDVVRFAKDPTTALHTQFDWDDTEAAHKWRLEQAGRIIRLQVKVIEDTSQVVRAFVSLTPDRVGEERGYRSISDVLSDEDKRSQMLGDALAELSAVRRKYQSLTQLAGVWESLDAAIYAQHKKRKEAVPA